MIGRVGLHASVLLQIFEDAGANEPTSHLATGNVSFGWSGRSMRKLIASTQEGIEATIGRFEPVFVRSIASLSRSIRSAPFQTPPIDDVVHRCVTFTKVLPTLELPLVSARRDTFIFASEGTDLYSVLRSIDGRGGNPNLMIEKVLSCAATTRNWNTIERIVRLHE
jgi:uncharacterized protein (DUF1697 family)